MELRWAAAALDRFMQSARGILVVHHGDADGSSAAALIVKAADRYNITVVDTITPKLQPYITPDVFSSLINYCDTADSLISLDLPIHEDQGPLPTLAKTFRFLAIDHHGDAKLRPLDLSFYGIIHLHSYLLGADKPSTYCAGKLTYDILDTLGKGDGLAWLGQVSIIGDFGERDWPSLFEPKPQNYDTLKTISDTFNWTLYQPIDNRHCFQTLARANQPEDVIQDPVFMQIHETYKSEIDRVADDFEENHQLIAGKLVYELDSKYPVNSPASYIAAHRHPDEVVIFFQKMEGGYRLEGRNFSKKVHIGKLLESLCKGIGSGGGHDFAGGGIVWEQHYNTLIDRLNRI